MSIGFLTAPERVAPRGLTEVEAECNSGLAGGPPSTAAIRTETAICRSTIMKTQLDLITIGRSSVDLYGGQVGGRLEDMASFSKYIGGSPTNIAAGAARLGLRSGLITRVGDEHMGRFIREELEREGVDTEGVRTDPERLTALVILGIRNDDDFPLIFYRENCADMALSTDDIDPEFIGRSRCVCPTGTHLSHPDTKAAVLKALGIARERGISTALDIDFRPNLWGLAGHGDGDSRFIASERVTETLQAVLDLFDLIVGTEEEFHIAGGSTDTVRALRTVRELTSATLVCKRGPMGATAFDGEIPDSLDEGVTGRGFEVEVFNVLGAGDGFMAGLLKGWLTGRSWSESLEFANACGAFAVSRHGCTPSYPSWKELSHFLEKGAASPALRRDAELEHIHWSTNRGRDWPALCILDLEDPEFDRLLPDGDSITSRFRQLCADAVRAASGGSFCVGIICDDGPGRRALTAAAGGGLWIGRPANGPGRPLHSMAETLGHDFGGLAEWPVEHTVVAALPLDGAERQMEDLLRLHAAARRNRLELMIRLTGAGDRGSVVPDLMGHIHESGVRPDWWMVEPQRTGDGWKAVCSSVEMHDRHSRGVILDATRLGGDAAAEEFGRATGNGAFSGIACGHRICGDAARLWLSGSIDDAAMVRSLAAGLTGLGDGLDRRLARSDSPK